jgi:hypothetical protein
MKNNILSDICKDILSSEDFKDNIKLIIKPMFQELLNEISIYLFFFIFFILSSFLLHLGILVLLIRYNKTIKN